MQERKIPGTLPINGFDLSYVSDGEGTPVLLVHGAISDHRVREPLREKIAAQHRFIAYDQRYFGTRNWPDPGGSFSADTHATDLVAIVEALDAGPESLVG